MTDTEYYDECTKFYTFESLFELIYERKRTSVAANLARVNQGYGKWSFPLFSRVIHDVGKNLDFLKFRGVQSEGKLSRLTTPLLVVLAVGAITNQLVAKG